MDKKEAKKKIRVLLSDVYISGRCNDGPMLDERNAKLDAILDQLDAPRWISYKNMPTKLDDTIYVVESENAEMLIATYEADLSGVRRFRADNGWWITNVERYMPLPATPEKEETSK